MSKDSLTKIEFYLGAVSFVLSVGSGVYFKRRIDKTDEKVETNEKVLRTVASKVDAQDKSLSGVWSNLKSYSDVMKKIGSDMTVLNQSKKDHSRELDDISREISEIRHMLDDLNLEKSEHDTGNAHPHVSNNRLPVKKVAFVHPGGRSNETSSITHGATAITDKRNNVSSHSTESVDDRASEDETPVEIESSSITPDQMNNSRNNSRNDSRDDMRKKERSTRHVPDRSHRRDRSREQDDNTSEDSWQPTENDDRQRASQRKPIKSGPEPVRRDSRNNSETRANDRSTPQRPLSELDGRDTKPFEPEETIDDDELSNLITTNKRRDRKKT